MQEENDIVQREETEGAKAPAAYKWEWGLSRPDIMMLILGLAYWQNSITKKIKK